MKDSVTSSSIQFWSNIDPGGIFASLPVTTLLDKEPLYSILVDICSLLVEFFWLRILDSLLSGCVIGAKCTVPGEFVRSVFLVESLSNTVLSDTIVYMCLGETSSAQNLFETNKTF